MQWKYYSNGDKLFQKIINSFFSGFFESQGNFETSGLALVSSIIGVRVKMFHVLLQMKRFQNKDSKICFRWRVFVKFCWEYFVLFKFFFLNICICIHFVCTKMHSFWIILRHTSIIFKSINFVLIDESFSTLNYLLSMPRRKLEI